MFSLPTAGKAFKTDGKYIVQGSNASELEFHVAIALDKLEIAYIYQYAFLGGRVQRGGFIADFLALTHPLATPIWVHGRYWHRGKQRTEDDLQQQVMQFYHRGEMAEPVVFWEEEVSTPEDALNAVRRELRV